MARANLLESIGDTVEAGEIHYAEGRQETAIPLFLKDKNNECGLQRALECIMEGLWQNCSFGVLPQDIQSDPMAKRLLQLSTELDRPKLTPAASRQVTPSFLSNEVPILTYFTI